MGTSRRPRNRRRARALAQFTRQPSVPHGHRYRVAAISAGCCSPPDLILADGLGNTFLMTPSSRRPEPLDRANRDALGMFYEPTIDLSWHTITELRHSYYDAIPQEPGQRPRAMSSNLVGTPSGGRRTTPA